MKRIFSFFLAIAAALSFAACNPSVESSLSPVLTIEGGQVQGVTADLDGVFVYRGIPYAAPPIGDLRWKAPQPVVPWDGVLACKEFGPDPMQNGHQIGRAHV